MEPFTLTREQVRELDRRAIEGFGVPGIVLMENAGRGAAELLTRLNPDRKPTVILCGPGNNGGDGFVIARHLDNHGWPAHVVFAADRVPTRGDAAPNYNAAFRAGLLVGRVEDGLSADGMAFELVLGRKWKGWVVDALFGTGLSRPLDGTYADLIG